MHFSVVPSFLTCTHLHKVAVNKSAQSNLGIAPHRGAVAHVRRKVPIGYNGEPQIRPKLPLPVDRSPKPTTCLIPGPVRPVMPNGIRIRSAVFPQCTGQTDRQTERPTDRSRESLMTIGRCATRATRPNNNYHSVQNAERGQQTDGRTAMQNEAVLGELYCIIISLKLDGTWTVDSVWLSGIHVSAHLRQYTRQTAVFYAVSQASLRHVRRCQTLSGQRRVIVLSFLLSCSKWASAYGDLQLHTLLVRYRHHHRHHLFHSVIS